MAVFDSAESLPARDGGGPRAASLARRQSGELLADPVQALAVEKLQSLSRALLHYKPGNGEGGWRARLGLARRPEEPPQGIYFYGGGGGGKAMLMGLFFAAAPGAQKRRGPFPPLLLQGDERLHPPEQKSR